MLVGPHSNVLLSVAAALLLCAGQVQAAEHTWNGGGSDNNWSTGLNWGTDGAPSAGGQDDDLFFDGTLRTTNTNDLPPNLNVKYLTFKATAGAFTIGGAVIDVKDDIFNYSSNLQTLNLGIRLIPGFANKREFHTTNGDMTVNGVISQDTGPLFTLNKLGDHTLTLTANSTYEGGTEVDAGILQVGVGGAGSIASNLVNINSGGTLSGTGTIGDGVGTEIVTIFGGGSLSPGDSEGADIGTLTIYGDLTAAVGSTTTLELGAPLGTEPGLGPVIATLPDSDPTTEHDAIELLGTSVFTLTAGSTIHVTDPLPLVAYEVGQYFDLIDGTIDLGTFDVGPTQRTGADSGLYDLKLPDLSFDYPQLRWDTSLFASHGTIFISVSIPEPSRAVLLSGFLLVALCRRRQG